MEKKKTTSNIFYIRQVENMDNNTSASPEDFPNQLNDVIEQLEIERIKTREPFVTLFSIREEVYQSIYDSIGKHGFDQNQPLIMWKEENILLDGHTRLKAVKALKKDGVVKLITLPVIYKSFQDEDEAFDYTCNLQFSSRKNITDGDLLKIGRRVLNNYKRKYGSGSKVDLLMSKLVNVSRTKASQLLVVLDRASVEQLKSIIDGNKTIRAIYKIVSIKREK